VDKIIAVELQGIALNSVRAFVSAEHEPLMLISKYT